jgi:cobalt-zinc-cadmium efflux system outer membrane protein
MAMGPATTMAQEPASLPTAEPLRLAMAFAEAVPAGNASLGLEQAVELAVANDPLRQQIQWQIEQAMGESYQATRLPNPVASLLGNEIGNEGQPGQFGLQWSQDIVRNGRPRLQRQYFDARICALENQLDIRRWQIVYQTATRYLEVCRRREELTVNEQQLEQLTELAATIDALYRAGEVSQIDVSNIDIEIKRLQQETVELRLQASARLRALSVVLGIQLQAGQKFETIHFDWDQTVAEILENSQDEPDPQWLGRHPQLIFAEARAEQQRRKIALARSERCPDVQVQGSLNYDSATDDTFAAFQIGLPLLRNDNKSGLIAAATAEYQQALEQLRETDMRLREMYALQAGELASYRSRVLNIRDQIIPAATKNLGQIRDAFTIGEASYLLLKTGFETVLQARQRRVAAEYELILSQTRLRTLLLDP